VPKLGKYLTPVDEKTIGKRLKDLRKARGLTQVELARQVGIPQTLLSEYERGTVRLHGAMVTGLAKMLHASTDELLSVKPLKENGSFQDRRLFRRLQRIEKLPKRAKQTLLRTIDLFLEGAEKR
jgi:transcriptional regulator with XRE-family HTH domain